MRYLVALLACSFAVIPNALCLPSPALDVSNGPPPPNYPVLSSPVAGQRLSRGKKFRFTYSNGATSATKCQFALSNSTGLFVLATDLPISKSKVNRTFTLPNWVANGTYDFVTFENDGFTADGSSYTDVVLSTVFVGPRPDLSTFTAPGPVIPSGQLSKLKKREPHLPKFHSPTSNQSVTCGQMVQIKFVDGEVDTDQAQFVLRKIGANDSSEDVVLTNPSSPTGLFNFTGYTLATNVSFPTSIGEGHYTLVAQEFYPEDPSPFFDAASTTVQILQDTTQSNTSPAAVRRSVPAGANGLQTPAAVTHEVATNTTAKSLANCQTTTPASGKLSEATTSATSNGTNSSGHIRRSAAIIEPKPSQLISVGSKFKCTISDPNARKESVKFVLRSFNGHKYSLGRATFKNGVATATLTCPQVSAYDTWLVEAQVNSAKRPKVFLTVVSTWVIVTRGPETAAPVIFQAERKREPHPALLVAPALNATIPLGESFDCQLIDGESTTEFVRFVLRFHDGSPDLQVGGIDIADSLAKTECQIPLSVDPGTYTFIAQENSLDAPETFSDVQSTSVMVIDSDDLAQEKQISSFSKPIPIRRRGIVDLNPEKANALD